MSILKRRRPPAADKGFTLIEATIAISIIGLISVVLANVFTVVVHSVPKTDERIDNAKTLQGLVTWLPQDVDSTPATGFDESPSAVTGCSDSPGTNLLRMEWAEVTGSSSITTRYIASYRHVLSDGRYRIKRVTCSGTGAGPFSNTGVRSVSSALPPLPAVVTVTRSGADVSLVTFTVTNLDGQIATVEAAPKNPAESLPTTSAVGYPTVPPTTAAPTTTSTTTTIVSGPTTTTLVPPPTTSSTLPPATTTTLPPPCVITSSALSLASVKNTDPNGNGNSSAGVGVLARSVTVTVTTTGYCNGLEARATTGAPNGELFHNFDPTATGYTVTFVGYPSSSELWADGDRLIQFYSPTSVAPYGSVTLKVT